jgi:hypothetical protein
VKIDFAWQQPYLKAVLETDPAKLPSHIEAATQAIKGRIGELQKDHMGTPEERQAIQETLAAIDLLRHRE